MISKISFMQVCWRSPRSNIVKVISIMIALAAAQHYDNDKMAYAK